MLISRTPFRISLFGGGSDIPDYFLKEGGKILSFTINKYCYVTARIPDNCIEHNIRVAYSKIETCQNADQIKHPLIRTAIKDFGFKSLELHYDSDLPANSGLGTSSSFAVGMANCFYSMKNKIPSKNELADKAIFWERDLLKENGGYQDQIASSYGGLNYIKFYKDNQYEVVPLNLRINQIKNMQERMLICYVPIKRFSQQHSVQKYLNEVETFKKISQIKEFVDISIKALKKNDLDEIGYLLNESWKYKKSLKDVSNQMIEDIYQIAIKEGALGGKLLGAGGGGFMLIWCKSGEKDQIIKSLNKFKSVNFCIENKGSQLIFNDL